MSEQPTPKLFKLDSAQLLPSPGNELGRYETAHAVRLGWDFESAGYEALIPLAVGDSVRDDDGDTWTRVQ